MSRQLVTPLPTSLVDTRYRVRRAAAGIPLVLVVLGVLGGSSASCSDASSSSAP